jgi:hypothetical protein
MHSRCSMVCQATRGGELPVTGVFPHLAGALAKGTSSRSTREPQGRSFTGPWGKGSAARRRGTVASRPRRTSGGAAGFSPLVHALGCARPGASAYPTCKTNTSRHDNRLPGRPAPRARRAQGELHPRAWGSRGARPSSAQPVHQHESASPFARRRRRSGTRPAQEPHPSRHGDAAARRPASRQIDHSDASPHKGAITGRFQGGEERRMAAVLTVGRRCRRGRPDEDEASVSR